MLCYFRRGPGLAAMALFVLAALVGSPAPARAQAVSGGLVGNLTDQSGLALPGATVTITETATNISKTTTTNESGYYTFPSLKDGTYKVVGELAGFKKIVRDGVIVDVNTTVRVDLKLEVGALPGIDHRRGRDARCCRPIAPTPDA